MTLYCYSIFLSFMCMCVFVGWVIPRMMKEVLSSWFGRFSSRGRKKWWKTSARCLG